MDLDIIWKEYYKYCMEKMGAEDKTAEVYLQTCMPLSLEEGVLVLDVATQFCDGSDKVKISRKDEGAAHRDQLRHGYQA